jgi:hypothetical protein
VPIAFQRSREPYAQDPDDDSAGLTAQKKGERLKKSLRDTLFGFRTKQNNDAAAAADAVTARKEKTLATVNEAETTSVKPPRVNRTIGVTEARLRARNKQSWMTSTKGWSDFFGRFNGETLADDFLSKAHHSAFVVESEQLSVKR